uniref:Uncharacterized protein n=1 Tax=Aquilaria malaccensis TaxID=223753 RepID=A0A4Y6GNI3_9ROSI|nr:hypothetical protein [Aquilaria malaccensis]
MQIRKAVLSLLVFCFADQNLFYQPRVLSSCFGAVAQVTAIC